MLDRRLTLRQTLRRAQRPRTVHDLAHELGWPVETTRLHLEDLVADGLAERSPGAARGRGRPPMTYRGTARMDAAGPTQFRLLAALLVAALDAAPGGRMRARQAGRDWAAHLPTTTGDQGEGRTSGERRTGGDVLDRTAEAVTALLAEHEFAPIVEASEAGAGEVEIALLHCPFLDLVSDHGTLICTVHAGMVDGIAHGAARDEVVAELTPFVQPDACQVRLSRPVPAGALR